MLKLATLTVLLVPSILATLPTGKITSDLIAGKNTRTLEILKAPVVDQNYGEPFLGYETSVNHLMYHTMSTISYDTEVESLANAVISFKPSDIKPLAYIRYWTLRRGHAVDVLKKSWMKSPELITGDLSNWIAFHDLDRNSKSIIDMPLKKPLNI